jgi:argininosuccinate synthase
MSEKVVLAFSGGLDTSYCAIYLAKEKKMEVHTAFVNTGAFSDEELKKIEQKAFSLGVAGHVNIDVTNQYYNQCIKYLIMGNILRNNTYPLSVSSERMFQALAVADYAKKIGACYVAHGSTGAGNDQVRFDLAFQILCPEIQIIAPIRDKKLKREEEINYLKEHGVVSDWKKAEYSINQGVWGTSVGGKETLTSNKTIPETAYPSQLTETTPKEIVLGFTKGELTSVNGESFTNPIEAIRMVEKLGSAFAIGRDMHVGDTILGIKGRVAFEAAGAILIIKAHHAIEKHTLTKWQMYWKDQQANWYGMLLHEAQYLDPVMRNIEKFIIDTQQNVTGKVIIQLKPYCFDIVGIESQFDLMSAKFATYGEENLAWDGDDVKGFTKIMSNQLKIYHSVMKNSLDS